MKTLRNGLIVFVCFVGFVSLYPHISRAGNPTNTDTGVSASKSSHDIESKATEINQQSLLSTQPIPSPLTYSLERQNLIDKLKIESQKGLVGYVALIGPMGQLVAYYTVRGKVSSLNSYLTTTEQINCPYGNLSNAASCVTLSSPDLDGSYGKNPSGIFFFTTSGQYIEWSGSYLYSNQPLNYTTAPVIVQSSKG